MYIHVRMIWYVMLWYASVRHHRLPWQGDHPGCFGTHPRAGSLLPFCASASAALWDSNAWKGHCKSSMIIKFPFSTAMYSYVKYGTMRLWDLVWVESLSNIKHPSETSRSHGGCRRWYHTWLRQKKWGCKHDKGRMELEDGMVKPIFGPRRRMGS